MRLVKLRLHEAFRKVRAYQTSVSRFQLGNEGRSVNDRVDSAGEGLSDGIPAWWLYCIVNLKFCGSIDRLFVWVKRKPPCSGCALRQTGRAPHNAGGRGSGYLVDRAECSRRCRVFRVMRSPAATEPIYGEDYHLLWTLK